MGEGVKNDIISNKDSKKAPRQGGTQHNEL